MDERGLPGALISTDTAFRGMVRQVLGSSGRAITIACEIVRPLSEMDADSVGELQRLDPELIFLDLEQDPTLGIRFAQFLSESKPHRQFIAAGPVLQPELLMEAMRAGISEYLTKPVTPDALGAALDRIERKLGRPSSAAAHTPGRLIATFSLKGGSGATMVTVNLGIYLQRLTKKKIVLVDLDIALGEVALFLGMQPRFTFIDMIRNFHRMDADLLASYIDHHESGVHLLAGPLDLEKPEDPSAEDIHKILTFLRQHYDYVVVDTSKSFAPATLAALEQADEILLVATADLPSIRNIKRAQPLLQRVTGTLENKVRLVVNRYKVGDPISLEDVQKTLGMEVYATLPNDYPSVTRSINAGKPLALDRDSKFNNDLGALAVRVAGLGASSDEGGGPLGSFKKLFRRKQQSSHE